MMVAVRSRILALILACLAAVAVVGAHDWPEWRGPNRDGSSAEASLAGRWSPSGENVAWSFPFGGRPAPVVLGNLLHLQTTTVADIAQTQERPVAVDADSGKAV